MTTGTDLPAPVALLLRQVAAATGAATAAEELASLPFATPALSGADWEAFADLAIERHYVAPLIAPGLPADIPAEPRARLAAAARDNALAATVQIAETRRIREALAGAGIAMTVVKGWPLSQRLYPGAETRHIGDLDLLVAPGDVVRTVACLGELGFEISQDPENRRYRHLGDHRRTPGLLATSKHLSLTRPQTGMEIELHWRLMSLAGWPELVDRPGALTLQETEAGPLQVPEDRTHLIYLAVHGALHAWDRLKWLADIALFARARGPATLAQDLAAARELRLARPLAFALSLSHRLLGSPLPEAGLDQAFAPRPRARLEARVLARLARASGPHQTAHDARRYAADVRAMRLGLASGLAQHWGIVHYDTLRRLRLPGAR